MVGVVVVAGLAGCSSDLTCPGGRVARGEACVCAPPDVEVNLECRRPVVVPGGGSAEGPRASGPSGGAGGDAEAGVATVPKDDGGIVTEPRSDASVPAPSPDPADARVPGVTTPAPPAPPIVGTSAPDGGSPQGPRPVPASQCGNGFIEAGEECEIGTDPAGWNARNCSTDCRRTLYTLCEGKPGDCPVDATCFNGVCAPRTCGVGTVAEQLSARRPDPCELACARVPLNSVLVVADLCVMRCVGPGPSGCPSGMRCEQLDLDPDLTPEQEPYVCVNDALQFR